MCEANTECQAVYSLADSTMDVEAGVVNDVSTNVVKSYATATKTHQVSSVFSPSFKLPYLPIRLFRCNVCGFHSTDPFHVQSHEVKCFKQLRRPLTVPELRALLFPDSRVLRSKYAYNENISTYFSKFNKLIHNE